MITQITEHFGYHVVLLEDTSVVGKAKIDMAALIQQGMIFVAPTYYSVLIHKWFIMDLLDPERVSITDCENWLYVSVGPDTKEGYDAKHFATGEQFAGDHADVTEVEEEEPQEQFVPPPPEPVQQEARSSSWPPDQWA